MIKNYPPSISSGFAGAGQPHEGSGYKYGNRHFFNTFRNEKISRRLASHYDWGDMDIPYVATPKTASSAADKYMKLPLSQISMLDAAQQSEVDNFYLLCQLHRDQIKDRSGTMHPLSYFKRREIVFQCPGDPTSTYLKYPERYVQYKNPPVLPITMERTYRSPNLPDRALTGVFSPISDNSYKN